ncbi:MAG: lipoprotein-releasing system ATP-binding protein LolD [Bdellovibrionaceae bacterium]|nr:lipoprotein-releasing system ATP-binding protein LolD [Pseudobdellovibrionaceae bacterium]
MSEIKKLLETKSLCKKYKKDKKEIEILKDVSLSMSPGECVAITGPSGAGKSTLLHLLGTLEPPTSGQILFEGTDLTELRESELAPFRNRMLGFVFQFHHLLPEFTALENVMMPALIAGHSRGPASKQAEELLKFAGLGHRLQHRPSELSGGEQQRVAIARAVILRPRLLLADELTGNLDSAHSDRVVDLLSQLNRQTGIGILLVTHDDRIAGHMQRTIHMRDGQIVSETR